MSAAYDEGWKAYTDGKLRTANPYPGGKERRHWFDGWDDAQAESRQEA